jgi:hypothetical protein
VVSRNVVLFAGAMAWAGVILDTAFHIAIGDPVIPALFAVILIVWFVVRVPQLALRRAS